MNEKEKQIYFAGFLAGVISREHTRAYADGVAEKLRTQWNIRLERQEPILREIKAAIDGPKEGT